MLRLLEITIPGEKLLNALRFCVVSAVVRFVGSACLWIYFNVFYFMGIQCILKSGVESNTGLHVHLKTRVAVVCDEIPGGKKKIH